MKLIRLVRGVAQSLIDSYQRTALFEEAFKGSGSTLEMALAMRATWLHARDMLRKALPHLHQLPDEALADSALYAIERGAKLETQVQTQATTLAEQHRRLQQLELQVRERQALIVAVTEVLYREAPPTGVHMRPAPLSPRLKELRDLLPPPAAAAPLESV